MRAAIILILIASIANMCLSAWIGHHAKPCLEIFCIDLYDPVCGKQVRKDPQCDEVEYRIFTNSCYMLRANSCGKVNYIPCVHNQCKNSTTPTD